MLPLLVQINPNNNIMNSSARPLILTTIVLGIIVIAGFASLFVLDVVPQAELQQAFIKTLLIVGITLTTALAIWGVLKLAKK